MSEDQLQPLRITASGRKGVSVVTVAGELDLAGVDQLLAAVRGHLASGPVVLDLGQLSFMDSSGVRALARLVRDAQGGGVEFTIKPELQRVVRQVLEISGMLDLLPLGDSGAAEET